MLGHHEAGGLGIIDIRLFNMAMYGKWIFNMVLVCFVRRKSIEFLLEGLGSACPFLFCDFVFLPLWKEWFLLFENCGLHSL